MPAESEPRVPASAMESHEASSHPEKNHSQLEEASDSSESHVEFSEERRKKLVRRLDWILIPQITFLYLLAYLDRGNIGNAKIAGMQEDLKLDGVKYNMVVMIFFVPYGLLEVPSNIVLKMVRPSLWISFLVVSWGVVMALMSIVKNYEGLLAARFFLGVAEAGMFPGLSFLLTMWYTRYEVASRLAYFYAGASLAGAFSGLLAYIISHMDGMAGLEGWRWIFLIEGAFTVFCGLFVPFTLPDSPHTARLFTPEERKYLVRRLQVQTGSGQGTVTNDEKMSKKHIMSALKEWKLWFAITIWLGNAIPIYGFTYTVPSVVVQLGYTNVQAQLMVVPIYVVATISVVVLAKISDRMEQRSPVVIFGFLAGAGGFLALLVIPHPAYPGLTYGFLFLAASGIFAPIMPALGWFGNNLAPSSKRAVGMAMVLTAGNLVGGLLGSNIFFDDTMPRYFPGYGTSFAIMLAAAATAFASRRVYKKENEKRDSVSEDEIRGRYTEDELLELGDKSPYFRYTL